MHLPPRMRRPLHHSGLDRRLARSAPRRSRVSRSRAARRSARAGCSRPRSALRGRLPLLRALHHHEDLRRRRPSRHAGRTARGWPRLSADEPLGRVRPPLRGDRGSGAAGRTRRSRRSSDFSPARSGSSPAWCSGGAVQDLVILLASVRRNGRSLGAMARDEIGPVAGTTALVAILGIMVVLIAVLALVVVNALAASPWGVVTIGLTIPIALLMGVHLRWLRPGARARGERDGSRAPGRQRCTRADGWPRTPISPRTHAHAPDARDRHHGVRLRRVRAARCGCCSRRAIISPRS